MLRHRLKELRCQIFVNAQERNLAHQNDVLVEHGDSSLRPASWKLAEDVWYLITTVHMKKSVHQVLLKDGKHDRQYLRRRARKISPQKDPTDDILNTRII